MQFLLDMYQSFVELMHEPEFHYGYLDAGVTICMLLLISINNKL